MFKRHGARTTRQWWPTPMSERRAVTIHLIGWLASPTGFYRSIGRSPYFRSVKKVGAWRPDVPHPSRCLRPPLVRKPAPESQPRGRWPLGWFGGHSAWEPHDPIPNSTVKPRRAQGTAVLTVGEQVAAKPTKKPPASRPTPTTVCAQDNQRRDRSDMPI